MASMAGEGRRMRPRRREAVGGVRYISPWMVVALSLALLMTRDLRGMHVFRTIYYIPAVIGGVAMALVWSWVFNPDNGILNYLLRSAGLGAPNWLGSPDW